MQALLIFFASIPSRPHHFVRKTAVWVTPPGTHFSPGKHGRTFPSSVPCTFPLKHVSAEAAKWLHNIILEKASRNAISELLRLTLYCPFCADLDGPQIILEWIFIWHIPGKQLASMKTFRFCTIYFLDFSTVLWVSSPLFQDNLMHIPVASEFSSSYWVGLRIWKHCKGEPVSWYFHVGFALDSASL